MRNLMGTKEAFLLPKSTRLQTPTETDRTLHDKVDMRTQMDTKEASLFLEDARII